MYKIAKLFTLVCVSAEYCKQKSKTKIDTVICNLDDNNVDLNVIRNGLLLTVTIWQKSPSSKVF